MGFLRLIVWALILFIFYKIYKYVAAVFKVQSSENAQVNRSAKPKKHKYQISKDDIIDADFEEIESKKADNSKK